MGWIKGIRNFKREWRDVQKLLSTPRKDRPITLYSEDTSSFNQFEGYLATLMERYQRPVAYVTSDPEDPLFVNHHEKMSVFYASRIAPTLIPRIDSAIFITTMPELGKLHIERPRKAFCLYIFHSLNSIHEVYRPGAFDHYDAFFCAGPHHRKELETHFELKALPKPSLFDVGYYKLDRIYQAHRSYKRRHPDRKTILVAPSWGKGNLLESHGIEIVGGLLELGARIVVRPHPCFFLPIYPVGRQVVAALGRRFEDHPRFELERSIVSEDSFHEADLMVSDFSGAAFEYALGTSRPVLFIDVARKTMNPNWRELGLPTFEDTMRYQVGRVLEPHQLSLVGQCAAEMLDQTGAFTQQIEEMREMAVYNFGRSAAVGAEIIDRLCEGIPDAKA